MAEYEMTEILTWCCAALLRFSDFPESRYVGIGLDRV